MPSSWRWQHPLGIGPAEFRNLRVKEEPHDTYVTLLHVYGWGGGLMYIVFIVHDPDPARLQGAGHALGQPAAC